MRLRNWPLWAGLVLAIAAFLSYFLFFARFVITRDIPWVNVLLFIVATVLLIAGVRRAQRKVWPSIVAVIGIGVFALFIFAVTIGSKMPASHGAPHVGQKAPDFALRDTTGRIVMLSSLLASSPRGVLLIFYRGYW
jgi:predicted neutral ceramidase superfamily lipid hydrolase